MRADISGHHPCRLANAGARLFWRGPQHPYFETCVDIVDHALAMAWGRLDSRDRSCILEPQGRWGSPYNRLWADDS